MIPDNLRSLTVRQPHASAIVSGLKTIENRRWEFPSTITRPSVIAIHAGLKVDSRWQDRWPPNVWVPSLDILPKGVIIGVVTVVACSNMLKLPDNDNRWTVEGHWHWVLSDARKLRTPIPYRGRQTLTPLSGEIVEQIKYQLGD